MRYRATVAYDGTGYHGFQRQSPEHEPTIQGEIERALVKLEQPNVSVMGSGRTDAGVHAVGQVIALDAEWRHGTPALQRALNAALPGDISVQSLTEAAPDFHPRYGAVSREYVYTICNAPVRHPLWRLYALHVVEPLDVQAMEASAATLIGEHDFAAFGLPTVGQVTVRRMMRAECRAEPPFVRVELEANGFLYRMVRSIVGTLKLAGAGELSPAEFGEIVASVDRSRAGTTAPANGLCLIEVMY